MVEVGTVVVPSAYEVQTHKRSKIWVMRSTYLIPGNAQD